MKACLLIRDLPPYRRDAFAAGLEAAGYQVTNDMCPSRENVLVVWNRYGYYNHMARAHEKAGGTVIVAENGYLGRDLGGKHWYAMAKHQHNGAGEWFVGGNERWDSLGIPIAPWRNSGSEIVILATRHIGPEGIAEPRSWVQDTVNQLKKCRVPYPIRVRPHPGEKPCTSLEKDLENARYVVTWGSGAALKALLMGIWVFYGFEKWIGASAAVKLAPVVSSLGRDSTKLLGPCDRLGMFRRLAWAMWNTEEIATGEPFRCLLK